MDLTSLSSNLPRNNPSAADDQPDDEEPTSAALIMSAFKQAAQAVTALYRTAGEQAERARREGQKEGYQECLDDLLALQQRLEGKADPATREIFKQWALGRRRKLGPRAARREEREASSDSDIVDRQRSSSPPTQQPVEPEPTPQPTPQQQQPHHQPQIHQTPSSPMRRSPPPAAAYAQPTLPQMTAFNFQASHHMPRHVPAPPETSDIELPDNDSPPTSPRITPQQNLFHQHKTFGPVPNERPRGRHSRPRAGGKRRFESINDFFDIAGIEKMNQSKKGRFQ